MYILFHTIILLSRASECTWHKLAANQLRTIVLEDTYPRMNFNYMTGNILFTDIVN